MRRWKAHERRPLEIQTRGLRSLDVRTYRPLGTPIEFRFYQRYTTAPLKQSGVQFLTHYSSHRRWEDPKDVIDYLNWGKEQGQAHLPHRHHRVAFDANDSMHPTKLSTLRSGRARSNSAVAGAWFENQDPSLTQHPDIDPSFDPHKRLFSKPAHFNPMFTRRQPGEGRIQLNQINSSNQLWTMVGHTNTLDSTTFGNSHTTLEENAHGRMVGVDVPYRGEPDRRLMQSMSMPLNPDQTITTREGRFSKLLYINNPSREQALEYRLTPELAHHIDECTNALHSKMVVLTSAQSGVTDAFCSGTDWERVTFDLNQADFYRVLAENAITAAAALTSRVERRRAEQQAQQYLDEAREHESRADRHLRDQVALLWRVYTAPRPLLTHINGRCRGTGCGVALLPQYAVTRDSTELLFDGPEKGLTPFSGAMQFLARHETGLKYPGLAEFALLTGAPLYAGDALKLGWTDLFTTLNDVEYHIQDWFDNSEHMHNDAIAWQIGQLLDTCFRMNPSSGHVASMERAAVNPTRAQWIEDAFADQSSVEDILATLTTMESLSLSDPHNRADANTSAGFTLAVADGVTKLTQNRLHFSLAPWDIKPPTVPEGELPPDAKALGKVFLSYFLQNRRGETILVHMDDAKLQQWREQRHREYLAHQAARSGSQPRHVFVRLEGCEGKLVDFEFDFNPSEAGRNVKDEEHRALVNALEAAVVKAFGMPHDRRLDLGWCLPTLDTCALRNDDEIAAMLRFDPSIEGDTRTALPPLYLVAKRRTLYLSEWAFAVKHKLLLQSPFALKATLQLLRDVRGGSSEEVQTVAQSISSEYRYVARLLRRRDFRKIGSYASYPVDQWDRLQTELATHLNKTMLPMRPAPVFDEVFERNVTVDGHHFLVRPRWEPRTVGEVRDADVAALRDPLQLDADGGAVEIDPGVLANKSGRLGEMINSVGGYEVVHGLGEGHVAPLVSNAKVPDTVDFYQMARHPITDVPTSWRYDVNTPLSEELFQRKYEEAYTAVYDPSETGKKQYWPNAEQVNAPTAETDGDVLKDRLWKPLHTAESKVDPWARELRNKARNGTLQNRLEVATQDEKYYDDYYYQWFVQPGVHPNPSGIIRGGRAKTVAGSADKRPGGQQQQQAEPSVDVVDEDVPMSAEAGGDEGMPPPVGGEVTVADLEASLQDQDDDIL